MDCYCAMSTITYRCLVNGTSFLKTHICCYCSTVLFLYNSECTLHFHRDIIDIAFNLLICASKDTIRLRLLALLVTFVLWMSLDGLSWGSQCIVFNHQLTWLFSYRMGGVSCVPGSPSVNLFLGCGSNHKTYIAPLFEVAFMITIHVLFQGYRYR